MQLTDVSIEPFFRAFESKNNAGNMTDLAALFADTFMAAGPQGTQAVRASDFALALPKRKQLFDKLGCRSTALVSVHETPLDTRFVMAGTRWRMTFVRDPEQAQDVIVDSVFIVDKGTDPFKIVFYLANQDVMEILKRRGIMAA